MAAKYSGFGNSKEVDLEAIPDAPAYRPAARPWWRMKTRMIPVLALISLSLFATFFCPAHGTKGATEIRKRAELKLALKSLSLQHSARQASCAGEELLQQIGPIPKDIGVASGEPFEVLVWDLHSGGDLWYKEYEGEWTKVNDRSFLVAPVSVKTSATTQTALAVDAYSGQIIYSHFVDGKWQHDDWQELETDCSIKFLSRPTAVSRAEGRIDVFNTDSNGDLWIVSYDGSSWSEWQKLGSNVAGEVSATSWSGNRLDVFVKSDENFLHRYWTADEDWDADWEDLGNPFDGQWSEGDYSMPMATSFLTDDGHEVIELFVNAGSSAHKQFRDGEWSDWTIVSASHEGYEFADTQSLVSGDGVDGRPYGHIISRGTDDCIHYNALENREDGINWGFWSFIWCLEDRDVDYPTKDMPTSAVRGEDGITEFVVRDLEGNVLRWQIQGKAPPTEYPGADWENFGQPEAK